MCWIQEVTDLDCIPANLNALINPYEYSSFFPEMGMRSGQYEGFAYLGFGMIVLCAIGIGLLIRRMIQMHKEKKLWIRMKQFIKKHASGLVSLSIVVIDIWVFALTTWVYIGKYIILQVYLPDFVMMFLLLYVLQDVLSG